MQPLAQRRTLGGMTADIMTAAEAAQVTGRADLDAEGRAAVAALALDARTLARKRAAAQRVLDETAPMMRALIRGLDSLGVQPGQIDRLTDYSSSQRALAVRGLTRHPGGVQPPTGRRGGRPRKATA